MTFELDLQVRTLAFLCCVHYAIFYHNYYLAHAEQANVTPTCRRTIIIYTTTNDYNIWYGENTGTNMYIHRLAIIICDVLCEKGLKTSLAIAEYSVSSELFRMV